MNTLNFFGHLATSVGESTPSKGDEVLIEKEEKKRHYKKVIYRDGKLVGATFIDTDVDAGVIHYLIKERVDIDPYKDLLIKKPKDVSLWLMLKAEKKSIS
jgi:NAD(P)H-nitrite reductase large subunit